jgi:chromosome segregation ATPase
VDAWTDFVCHEIVREKASREATEAKLATAMTTLEDLRKQLAECKRRETQLGSEMKALHTHALQSDGKVSTEQQVNDRLLQQNEELTKQLEVAQKSAEDSARVVEQLQRDLPGRIDAALREREREVTLECDRRIKELEVNDLLSFQPFLYFLCSACLFMPIVVCGVVENRAT